MLSSYSKHGMSFYLFKASFVLFKTVSNVASYKSCLFLSLLLNISCLYFKKGLFFHYKFLFLYMKATHFCVIILYPIIILIQLFVKVSQ